MLRLTLLASLVAGLKVELNSLMAVEGRPESREMSMALLAGLLKFEIICP